VSDYTILRSEENSEHQYKN